MRFRAPEPRSFRSRPKVDQAERTRAEPAVTQMMESTSPHWRVPDPRGMRWAHWGAHSAVFNPISGETHLLSALPAEVLSLLGANPDTCENLAARLSVLCEVANDAEWAAKVRALLDSLEILDLVERAEE